MVVALVAFLVLLILGKQQVVSLDLTDTQVEIIFRRLFRRYIIRVNIADTVLLLTEHEQVSRKSVFVDDLYYVLHIVTNGKTEAFVSTRGMFTLTMLRTFMQDFTAAKAKL
ncbi:hypothetical protein [Chitinophaga qingshengii]|uniref:Uncharacterized protein n=1 Tax=Chitinophaga qingshengii TaxID=1569794 RepID=A0ABR7TGB7_9BACT|nr:hypothetical protein [Chitinophaga qingshengii]MBC9928953.1 hypothetical protein [Chitinophaga qingshengii]